MRKKLPALIEICLCTGLLLMTGCGNGNNNGKSNAGSGNAEGAGSTVNGTSDGIGGIGNGDAGSTDGTQNGSTDNAGGTANDNSGAGNGSANAGGMVTGNAYGTEVNVKGDPNQKSYVNFSKDSGCYAEDFDLELSTDLGGSIYYTTDGSNPSESDTAVLYTEAIDVAPLDEGPLTVSAVSPQLFCTSYSDLKSGYSVCYISSPDEEDVDRCITVRAAVKAEDGTWYGSDTCTYFIGAMDEHIPGLSDPVNSNRLAVISITMNYDDLFDYDTGIYVKGAVYDEAFKELYSENKNYNADDCRKIDANYNSRGKEWEREAHIDFFEAGEEGTQLVLSQDCGIRIQGNYSRSDLQKSFRLYARKKYGSGNFDYAVWGNEAVGYDGNVLDEFDTMVLRAGGNCAFTAKFNDTFWQTLIAMDGSFDVATKASRACVVYLNGEYWGLYVLEEDYSEDYFEDHYGVDGGSVVAYKGDAEKYASGYKLDLGDAPEGENENYYFADLMNFFDTHSDCSSQEDYEELCKLVDEESVLDYFAVEVWINNKWDWPGKNWEMWKTVESTDDSAYSDGRWRFTLFDVEFGGVSGSSDGNTNTIAEDNYKPKGLLDKNTSNPAVLCFAYLMDNDDFRERYIERLNYLSDNAFEQNHAMEVLEDFEDEYSPFYEQFFARYPGSGSAENALTGGYASSSCIRAFLFKRCDYIPKMIEKSLQPD